MTYRTSLLPAGARMLGFVLPIALALFFIFAGLTKLSRPHELLIDVYAYGLIGPPSGRWVAAVLPHLEIVIGIALLSRVALRGALLLALLLCGIFLFAQASVIWRGLVIDCGCFGGASEESVGLWTLLRTSLLGVAALAALWLAARAPSHSGTGAI